MVYKSVNLEIFEDSKLFGKVSLLNLSDSLFQFSLLLLLTLYRFQIGFEHEQIFTDLVHSQRLG